MKRITLTDITLFERGGTLTFKEKVEIAKVLDRLGTDTIRLPAIRDIKPDTMATRTVARRRGKQHTFPARRLYRVVC